MKASRSQLARIHIAAKDLALDELVYRQILFNETGKRSAAGFSYHQAKKVLDYFESVGWKPEFDERRTPNAERVAEGQRPGFASPREKWMIKGLWADLSYAPKEKQQGALREFLWRRFHVSDLEFLSDTGAQKVINALLSMKEQAQSSKMKAHKENLHPIPYELNPGA